MDKLVQLLIVISRSLSQKAITFYVSIIGVMLISLLQDLGAGGVCSNWRNLGVSKFC